MMKPSSFIFKPSKRYTFVDKPMTYHHTEKRAYKPLKLARTQKEHGQVKPVKDFKRFGKGIIAGTGENPDQVFFNFIHKDVHKPFDRKQSPKYQLTLEDDILNSKRWSVGCSYHCPSEVLLPKRDKFRDYNFSNSSEEDKQKYQHYFLDTDHISVRVPDISKSQTSEKSTRIFAPNFGAHEESRSYWVPSVNKEESFNNRSGVKYDIINHLDNNLSGKKSMGILDKTVNNKRKGIAEFDDFRNPMFPNYNKKYQDLLKENNHIFYNYKGVFSELYDSAIKDGSLYLPFRRHEMPSTYKKKDDKEQGLDNPLM